MDENPRLNALPAPDAPPPLPAYSAPRGPFSHWVKKFLACNPFYLVSAALLLCGVYLVSLDTGFLQREIVQLTFNFSSLQFYELLLVVTAIVLARRRIWYDSVLLVGLENLLVLVPFILISQAALLDQNFVWIFCVAGGFAAFFRFLGLKKFFKELNLPRRMLGGGLLLLFINIVLPLIYRHLHESKVGTKPVEGAAYEMDHYAWLALMPAMFALINLLPRPKQTGDLLPQRRWLPMGLFTLWLVASGVHLRCLSYVYNFDWPFLFGVPLLWVILWSLYLRQRDFMTAPVPMLSRILLIPPLLVTFFALTKSGTPVFLALTTLDIVLYAILYFREKGNRMAFHLMLASVIGLVEGWLTLRRPQPALVTQFNAEKWMLLVAAGYLMVWVIRSRKPMLAALGSIIIAFSTLLLVTNGDLAWNLSIQLALLFFLVHSLRWEDQSLHGPGVLRISVGVVWVWHAWFVSHTGWMYAGPVIYGSGGLLLAAYLLMRLFLGTWKTAVLPIAAGLVLLAQPGQFVAVKARSTPVGVLAMTGSFLLFGLGTLAALTKSKWNRPDTSQMATMEPTQNQSTP